MLRGPARTLRRNVNLINLARSRTASTAVPQESDVVIVGGGPAGLALAGALSSTSSVRTALRVVLVEASDLDKVSNWAPPPGTYSNRVSSITNASQSFLQGE
ncbi:Ubiquinone biosynthesis monooxygenase COQ6, mitochondrial [Trametes pubescens]|uniref:Ubiquinone biosynthesis monooxygenase COQ6, mitochondrial n=1 Tax=Trametes pubescens TaxID=154538 RepID=A0A1M2VXW2_TRAPU|nr:Ubiquinone biosynthesis monooxygenase COQ6, mitochondrial [Trametes pubescens]